jgi:hypothetical protein
MTPAAVLLIATLAYRIFHTLHLSFSELDMATFTTGDWVDWNNCASVLEDGRFGNSIQVTGIYLVLALPLQMLLGFAIAFLINAVWRGRGALAIRLGGPAYTLRQLAEIDRTLAESEAAVAAGDTGRYARLNRAFHLLLSNTPQTHWTLKLLSSLWAQTSAARRGFDAIPERMRGSLAEHRAIRRAIGARDFERTARPRPRTACASTGWWRRSARSWSGPTTRRTGWRPGRLRAIASIWCSPRFTTGSRRSTA